MCVCVCGVRCPVLDCSSIQVVFPTRSLDRLGIDRDPDQDKAFIDYE